MKTALYMVIKFTPDIARNEPVNIGILAWCEDQGVLRFDDRALSRVTSMSRELGRNALEMMTNAIQDEFGNASLRDSKDFQEFAAFTFGTPFRTTTPLFVGVEEAPQPALRSILSNEVDSLLDRLVKPHRRQSARSPKSPKDALLDRYRQFLPLDQLFSSYEIKHTQTGLPRVVDLFLNHGADAAVDIFDLRRDSTRGAAIDAADKIRSKSQDILKGHEVQIFVAHLPADIRPTLADHLPVIKQMFKPESEIILTTSTRENEEVVRKLTGTPVVAGR